jgi:hypothetical protein
MSKSGSVPYARFAEVAHARTGLLYELESLRARLDSAERDLREARVIIADLRIEAAGLKARTVCAEVRADDAARSHVPFEAPPGRSNGNRGPG